MSAKNNSSEGGQDKSLPKTTVQTLPQNITAIQSLPTVQSMQNVQSGASGSLQNIQTAQTITGQATVLGKSISLELNPKLLVKTSGSTNIGISDNSKITNAFPVRLITQNMMPTIERSTQPQAQQSTSQPQVVTTISNFHVPLGPAAVANISTPRGTLATPLVRPISASQAIPIARSSVSTTVSGTQWQAKNASVVYAPAQQQQQRHPVPVVNRAAARPIVYASSQQQQTQPQQAQNQQTQPLLQQSQPRLVSPSPGRSVQATVVTATPSRLMTPVIQTQNNNITARIPTLTRPTTPQVVTSISQGSQGTRPVAQIIQPNQTSRSLTTAPVSRIAVTPPVIGAPNKVATVTSVGTSGVRQLTINSATSSASNQVGRIIQIPQNIQQQQQSQQSQISASRVVQAVTSLANFSQASRVISTSAATASNAQRISQAGSPVTRIAGLSLHPIPLSPVPASRATPVTHKITSQASTSIQQVTSKPGSVVTMQAQPQQPQHQQQIPALQRTISNVSSANIVAASAPGPQSTQIQAQYIHQPHGTTYYSLDASAYSQYRPTSVQQPVRLLVEPGFEQEPVSKPNASPRPSILRKREHDNSPGKANMSHKPHTLNAGVVKNLVPVLSAMSSSSVHSPPGSPKADGGNHSSGSTTVSATSSPGLDEEPEQSRITINPTVEMSPRKKPRKQQLTGVELIEPRCTEDMQFITEEKMKKEIKEEPKDRRHNSNPQDFKTPQPAPVRTKPVLSLIGSSWKNPDLRAHHYKRPSDVKPREERRPSVNEIAQQKHVLQKVNGWKVYHLTSQMEDFAETERTVHEKLKATLAMLESQQKNRQDESLERANELIKGNMQRSNLISEGMNEARVQLTAIFQHKTYVTDLLQRCGSKRAQKKR